MGGEKPTRTGEGDGVGVRDEHGGRMKNYILRNSKQHQSIGARKDEHTSLARMGQ